MGLPSISMQMFAGSVDWKSDVRFSVNGRSKNFARTVSFWLARTAFVLLGASVTMTLFYAFVPVFLTPLMFIRSAELIGQGERPRIEKEWVSKAMLSTHLQVAAVAAEDMRFFEHNGFDWEAIERARRYNKRGQKIRGASTISQQVAKNVFLWPQRSWIRKALEVYFTALIEVFWSKQRIMEVYLNVAEFGEGIYGVEAASQKFFKKPASRLSAHEAALMIAVLPNPRQYRVDRPSRYVRFRQTMILRRMWSARQTLPQHG